MSFRACPVFFITITLFAVTLKVSTLYADPCTGIYSAYQSQAQTESNASNKPITLNGPSHCTSGLSKISQINGPASADQTHFTQALLINGPFHADSIILDKTISINGPADLINTNTKALTIKGPLHASNSKLGTISLWAESAHFDQTSIQSLNITNDSAWGSIAKIYLNNHSTVTGDIVFTNNPPGIVYIDSSSKITGKITRGTLVNLPN